MNAMIADRKSLWVANIGQVVKAENYRGVVKTGRLLNVVSGVWGYSGDSIALVLDVKDDLGLEFWPAGRCKLAACAV